jgi:glutathione S-transferase
MPAYAVWGSELSPFALKLRALLDYAEVPYRWLPDEGGRLENSRLAWRLARAKRTRTVVRHPALSSLDEYPLVPYLIEDGRRFHYDTSALARWLDVHPARRAPALFPEPPALAFVAQLVDEAFDEFGLYMVHHMRWVLSAATNDAGRRLAHELRRLLPPGAGPGFGRRFAARQVRRLPYLFSVAPPGFSAGVAPELTPPARAGWPETHGLLDEAWTRYLAGMEAVLSRQPYLLGERFTVADASAYGQLGMNLADPSAADRMRALAPATFAWLCGIRDRRHVGSRGALAASPSLAPLLAIVMQTFPPLMRQNEAAWARAREGGGTLFNEPAFDRGRALWDGALLGRPFRSVAKTFQVRVWRDVCAAWKTLPPAERTAVEGLLDGGAPFGG